MTVLIIYNLSFMPSNTYVGVDIIIREVTTEGIKLTTMMLSSSESSRYREFHWWYFKNHSVSRQETEIKDNNLAFAIGFGIVKWIPDRPNVTPHVFQVSVPLSRIVVQSLWRKLPGGGTWRIWIRQLDWCREISYVQTCLNSGMSDALNNSCLSVQRECLSNKHVHW